MAELLILVLHVSEYGKVVLICHLLPFVKECLLMLVNLVYIGDVHVRLTQLILEHAQDLLDLVNLQVDGL
jgi:hypothetical protein